MKFNILKKLQAVFFISLLQFCASGNQRTTVCADEYSACVSNCDRDIAALIRSDPDRRRERMDTCHRDCEARYDECLQRVKVWDDVPVK